MTTPAGIVRQDGGGVRGAAAVLADLALTATSARTAAENVGTRVTTAPQAPGSGSLRLPLASFGSEYGRLLQDLIDTATTLSTLVDSAALEYEAVAITAQAEFKAAADEFLQRQLDQIAAIFGGR